MALVEAGTCCGLGRCRPLDRVEAAQDALAQLAGDSHELKPQTELEKSAAAAAKSQALWYGGSPRHQTANGQCCFVLAS